VLLIQSQLAGKNTNDGAVRQLGKRSIFLVSRRASYSAKMGTRAVSFQRASDGMENENSFNHFRAAGGEREANAPAQEVNQRAI
jgi:hypothetical protein